MRVEIGAVDQSETEAKYLQAVVVGEVESKIKMDLDDRLQVIDPDQERLQIMA